MNARWLVLFLLMFTLTGNAGETTRWGAKLTKATMENTPAPTLELPEGWRLCEGERDTGLNIREYYFTIETDGANVPAPVVKIFWTGVKVAKVYGGKCLKQTEDGHLEIQPTSSNPPTGFHSSMREGAVEMVVFHNLEGMQAGPYRDISYPKNEIQAHLNYLFAAREMMREMGFTQSADLVDGQINLYGFETNFPHGHEDCPPHFHIMTMWDRWQEIQATHYILDDKGRILRNNHYVVRKGKQVKDASPVQPLGATTNLTDRTGKVRLSLQMLADGTGVLLRVPGMAKEAMIRSEDAVESVDCFVRENAEAPWVKISTSRVTDDVVNGRLTVLTDCDGKTRREVWSYDPNVIVVLKLEERTETAEK